MLTSIHAIIDDDSEAIAETFCGDANRQLISDPKRAHCTLERNLHIICQLMRKAPKLQLNAFICRRQHVMIVIKHSQCRFHAKAKSSSGEGLMADLAEPPC